jgi:hypothetical protein
MTTSIAAAINALTGGTDYSKGATGWDGPDIKTNPHLAGLNNTNASLDIFNLGNHPLAKPQNNSQYVRQVTAAYNRTIFEKIYPDFISGGGRAY